MFLQIPYPPHDHAHSCWTSNLNGVFFPLHSGNWTVNWLLLSNQGIVSDVISTMFRKRNSQFSYETIQTRVIGKIMLPVISSARTCIHRQNIKEKSGTSLLQKNQKPHLYVFPTEINFSLWHRTLWPAEHCVTSGIFFGGEYQIERHSHQNLPPTVWQRQLWTTDCGCFAGKKHQFLRHRSMLISWTKFCCANSSWNTRKWQI